MTRPANPYAAPASPIGPTVEPVRHSGWSFLRWLPALWCGLFACAGFLGASVLIGLLALLGFRSGWAGFVRLGDSPGFNLSRVLVLICLWATGGVVAGVGSNAWSRRRWWLALGCTAGMFAFFVPAKLLTDAATREQKAKLSSTRALDRSVGFVRERDTGSARRGLVRTRDGVQPLVPVVREQAIGFVFSGESMAPGSFRQGFLGLVSSGIRISPVGLVERSEAHAVRRVNLAPLDPPYGIGFVLSGCGRRGPVRDVGFVWENDSIPSRSARPILQPWGLR